MGCGWLATLLLVAVMTPAIVMDALVVVVVARRLFDGADSQARGAKYVFRNSKNYISFSLVVYSYLPIVTSLFFSGLARVWLDEERYMGFNQGSERWLGSVEGQGLGR